MDVDWSNPEVVRLFERLAVCVQEQLEQDLTPTGQVAYLPYFGKRTAQGIFDLASSVDASEGRTSMVFRDEEEHRP